MTITELLTGADFTGADALRQVTLVSAPDGQPSGHWFLSPGPDSGQAPTALAQAGFLRIAGDRATRLRQALPAPQQDVVLQAVVRVISGELLIGAVNGDRPDPAVQIRAGAGSGADGGWQYINMAVSGPVDQVVLYAAIDMTVVERQARVSATVPGLAVPRACSYGGVGWSPTTRRETGRYAAASAKRH